MSFAPSYPTGRPEAAPTATPSSNESPPTTGSSSSKLTGVLATVDDLENWSPADAAEADDAVAGVAAYCRDYCPVRLACVEDACRLFRLEERAEAIRHTPAERVGVLGQPITAL